MAKIKVKTAAKLAANSAAKKTATKSISKTPVKAGAAKPVAAKAAATKAPPPKAPALKAAAAKAAPKAAPKADPKVAPKSATPAKPSGAPSKLIDKRIKELSDWRGETLSRMRALIKEAIPGVTEDWKWRGVPVWYQGGMICTGETYKGIVKLTFAKGAQLNDGSKLFNSSLEGNARRAIDIREGDKIDESAFKQLVLDAVALNSK